MSKVILAIILAMSIIALAVSISNYLKQNQRVDKSSFSENKASFYKTNEDLTNKFVSLKYFLDSLPVFTFNEKKVFTNDVIPSKHTLLVLFNLNHCQPCLEKLVSSIRNNKDFSDTTNTKIIFIGSGNSLFEVTRFKHFNKISQSVYFDPIDTVRKHLGIVNLPTTEWILDEKGRVMYGFYPDVSYLDMMENFHDRYAKMINRLYKQ